jgi:hypothetical protein
VCPSSANTGSFKMALVNGHTKVLKSKSPSPHGIFLLVCASPVAVFELSRTGERKKYGKNILIRKSISDIAGF